MLPMLYKYQIISAIIFILYAIETFSHDSVYIRNPGDDTEYRPDYFKENDEYFPNYNRRYKFINLCDLKRYNSICRRCNHRTKFSEYEIERARIYLQQWIGNASVPPKKPACNKLRVRQDFKCLSHEEKSRFIRAYLELYKTGVVDTLTKAHNKFWGSTHKTAEFMAFHNMMTITLEKKLLENANISLPYWDNTLEFSKPECSIVWDYFGHAGDSRNGYCIPDGPFKNVIVSNPTVGCIKREWGPNGKMLRFEGPEYITSYQQITRTDFVTWFIYAYNQHFKKHLSVGGDHGFMSNTYGPNDPMFYMYHNHQVNQQIMKWQMIREENVIPAEYGFFGIFNYTLNETVPVNISTSVINYFNVTLAEALQQGFGDLCYITDQFVEIINKILDNIPPKLPVAVHRLKQALPSNVFAYLFPSFANNISTYFEFDMADVGNCLSQKCKPLPQTPFFNATIGGRNTWNLLQTIIGIDTTPFLATSEVLDKNFTDTLNFYGYCSPYVF